MNNQNEEAKLSPSQLPHVQNCPVFQADPTPSEAAEDGTRLHTAVETRDMSLCNDEYEVTQVQYCLNYLDARQKKLSRKGNVCSSILEYPISSPIGRNGRMDAMLLQSASLGAPVTHAEVIDYKFGRVPIAPARSNVQLWDYVYRVFTLFPTANTVTAHLVYAKNTTASHYKFTRAKHLDKLQQRIVDIHAAYNDPFKKPRVSDSCRYCVLKAKCPAYNKKAIQTIKALPAPQGFVVPRNINAFTLNTPEKKGAFLNLATFISTYLDNMKKAIVEEAKQGQEITGYTLQKRTTPSKVDNVSALLTDLATKYKGRYTLQELVERLASVSMTSLRQFLEEAIRYDYPDMTKAQMQEVIKSSYDLYIKPGVQYETLVAIRGRKKKLELPEAQTIDTDSTES